MKIFILGGSGVVGSSILNEKKSHHQFISTFNTQKQEQTNAFRISFPEDIYKIEKIIEKEKPIAIINTIAYTNPDFCEKNQNETFEINVKLPEKICEISHHNKIKLIQLSTDYVFDGKKGNYIENDKQNPINYYGYTKKFAEDLVLKYSQNSVIRTSLLYGANPKVRFFNFVLKNLRSKKIVYAYNDSHSCPTLLDELVESIMKILEKDISGLFHVVGQSCVTRYEFAKTIAKKFNEDEGLIKPLSSKDLIAKRPKNTCLKNTKAQKSLNVKYSTIEEGIDQVFFQLHNTDAT